MLLLHLKNLWNIKFHEVYDKFYLFMIEY
jgi:hypothetical protein